MCLKISNKSPLSPKNCHIDKNSKNNYTLNVNAYNKIKDKL